MLAAPEMEKAEPAGCVASRHGLMVRSGGVYRRSIKSPAQMVAPTPLGFMSPETLSTPQPLMGGAARQHKEQLLGAEWHFAFKWNIKRKRRHNTPPPHAHTHTHTRTHTHAHTHARKQPEDFFLHRGTRRKSLRWNCLHNHFFGQLFT